MGETQPAIVIGDESAEQRHQVSDRITKSSNGKLRPQAWLKGQGQIKKARIEHQRGGRRFHFTEPSGNELSVCSDP